MTVMQINFSPVFVAIEQTVEIFTISFQHLWIQLHNDPKASILKFQHRSREV